MKTFSFQSRRNALLASNHELASIVSTNRERQFAFFSANLRNCMPTVHQEEHKRVFEQAIINQQLGALEQEYCHEIDYSTIQGWDKGFVERLKKEPGIICTFHTGSYRLLNMLLVNANVPFTLVVSSDVLKEQGPSIMKSFKRIGGTLPSSFSMINAEEPNALLRMMRMARDGRTLLLYIDGNTGSGDVSQRDNRLAIDFLGQSISVRKGIGIVSHMANRPIYPILSSRTVDYSSEFSCKEPIWPNQTKRREVYARESTVQLYRYLEDLVRNSPAQWEGWFYIHWDMILKKKEDSAHEKVKPKILNRRDWAVFETNHRYFLLEKETYTSYEIPFESYKMVKEYKY